MGLSNQFCQSSVCLSVVSVKLTITLHSEIKSASVYLIATKVLLHLQLCLNYYTLVGSAYLMPSTTKYRIKWTLACVHTMNVHVSMQYGPYTER